MNRRPSPGNSRQIRALAIEDNQDFARILGHLLKVMGCEVKLAPDAKSGLLIAGWGDLDIIFCDIGLRGDMDGLGFARTIRADAALAHTPLIAVSARTATSDRQQAMHAGFDRVLPKPVKFKDISNVLSGLRKGAEPGVHCG